MTKVFILFFSICLFGFLGCSSPKNLTSSTSGKETTEAKRDETATSEIQTLIDSTKTDGIDIRYFKVEFYPPEEKPAGPGPEPKKEPIHTNVNNEPKPVNKKPPDKGAIKSIEGLIISSSNEEKGITKTHEINNSQKTEEIVKEYTLETDITEEVAEDPYKWRYLLGIIIAIIVIGIGGYFLLRKSKLFAIIKNIFSS